MSSYIKNHAYDEKKVNDCHFHIERQYPIDVTLKNLEKIRSFFNLDRILILSLIDDFLIHDMSANAVALYLKEKMTDTYAFAGLSHAGNEWDSVDGCMRQAKFFYDVGFDGIKMLEGKPNLWHMLGRRLNSKPFDSMFAFAEAKRFPILLHAGDYLSDDTDALLSEVENILERYPALHLTLAHFANCVHDPARLERIFDKYENVTVDLALGGDFVLRFSENQGFWREFFIRHQDRILYGTDTYNQKFTEADAEADIAIRHTALRSFFEDREVFYPRQYQNQKSWYGSDRVAIYPMTDLPHEVTDKIYRKNFIQAFGEQSRKVNLGAAEKYTENILDMYQKGVYTTHAKKELPYYFSAEEKANMARGSELAVENLERIISYYKEETENEKR